MQIYVFTYIYIYVYIYIYIYMCVCVCVYMYISMSVCLYIHTYVMSPLAHGRNEMRKCIDKMVRTLASEYVYVKRYIYVCMFAAYSVFEQMS